MKELYTKLWNTFHPDTAFQGWALAIGAFCIVVGLVCKFFLGEKFFRSAFTMLGVILVFIIAFTIWIPLGVFVVGMLAYFIAIQFVKDGRWQKGMLYAVIIISICVAAYYIWLR